MIRQLKGTLANLNGKSAVIMVGGVGYELAITPQTRQFLLEAGKTGEPITIETYLAVREDALDLYGFSRAEERQFFERLISIPGIGPKGALAILAVAPAEVLRQAIVTGDTAYLTKISGIGQKRAEKIIMELKDKLGAAEKENISGRGELRQKSEIIEALQALGYSLIESREAVKSLAPELDTKAGIREALRQLGQKN